MTQLKCLKVASPHKWFFVQGICFLSLLLSATPRLNAQGPNAAAASFSCSTATGSIFPGDELTIFGKLNSYGEGIHPSDANFEWTGPHLVGDNDRAIFTAPDEPGTYTFYGKATLKANPSVFWNCSTSLAVKAFEPPTLSCQVSPSTVKPGEGATVTASANSPQNRPLTYAYSATAGTVPGTGPTAKFDSSGAPTGPISVTCMVTDDKGNSASASASVTVESPVGPPEQGIPWPLPRPSSRSKLPLQLGHQGLDKMGEVDQRLISALDQMGYVLRAHYPIPGGFALVTQAEQIYASGRPKPPPARFSNELSGPHNFGDYLVGLFTADPGYYRVIVFVVTNLNLEFSDKAPSKEQMQTLLGGPDALPSTIAVKTLPTATRCTALIYQFIKSGANAAPAVPVIPSPLSTETHLRQAGLWARLGLP